MTIEKRILQEKIEFTYGFCVWLGGTAKYVGNGSWVYLNDLEENLQDVSNLIDDYMEDVKEYEEKERLLNLEKERELLASKEILNLK